jgi:hypothetical protein
LIHDPRGAFANISRAIRFLEDGIFPEGPYRVRVIANHLRELDRFLNLLIDEVAIASGHPGFDPARLARQRNTAAKLGAVRHLLALPNPDDHRLRAIGRTRDCLFHCAGIARHPDRRGSRLMTSGWRDGTNGLRQFALGQALIPDKRDLDDLCRFYAHIARTLRAAIGAPPSPAFHPDNTPPQALTSQRSRIVSHIVTRS